MSRVHTLILSAAVVTAVISIANRRFEPEPVGDRPRDHFEAGETLAVTARGTEVFQRAFWKRPTDGDRIRNAERREWSGEDGVERWDWFLEVEPSALLSDYLLKQNAFDLAPAEAAPAEGAPEWFPVDLSNYEQRQSRRGDFTLLVEQGTGRLFATGRGGGFAAAAERPTPEPAVARAAGLRRLPNESPPNP